MNPLAAEDALAAALAFHKAPARHHDLLHGRAPLPAGVDKLLRLASGASPEETGIVPDAALRPGELAAAARFFVEQVLLAHDADHYRLLGVNRDASLDQIKEHHRLLMRMFHPDRDNGIDPEVKAAHAGRINLAYNALRQSDSRAAYDTQLRQASKPPAMAAPAARGTYRRLEPQSPGLMRRMPPFLARNFPHFVLGGIALIAAVSVASVYMDRPPEGAIGWEPGDTPVLQAAAPEPQQGAPLAPAESPAPALPEPPAARAEIAAAEPAPERAAQHAEPVAAVKPAPAAAIKPPPAAASAPTPIAKPAPARPAPTATVQAPAAAPRPASKPAATPPVKLALAGHGQTDTPAAPQPPRPAPAPAPAPAAAPATVPAETAAAAAVPAPQPEPPAGLSEGVLVRLVARLSERYAGGNLETFMALFDDAARSEAGGKNQIRSDYENLFRNTQQRSIVIWDMDWQRNGDQAKGEGSFQARVVRNGETAARTYTGRISIEAVWRGNAALIRTFNHSVKR